MNELTISPGRLTRLRSLCLGLPEATEKTAQRDGLVFTPDTELFAPYEAPAWRWWSVDLESGAPASLVEETPPRSASNRVLAAGGIEYIANLDPDTGTTTLMVPQADGRLTPGLAVTGYPYGLIQLR